MLYVIRRVDDGKYVAKPDSQHSYTSLLERARVFRSKEEATADLCPENEYVVAMTDAPMIGLRGRD